MNPRDRELGMRRTISRRDFLNGVSVALTGSLVAPAWPGADGSQSTGPEQAPGYYPPARTGSRGSHPGSSEVAHQLRDAKARRQAGADTRQPYDLVGGRG